MAGAVHWLQFARFYPAAPAPHVALGARCGIRAILFRRSQAGQSDRRGATAQRRGASRHFPSGRPLGFCSRIASAGEGGKIMTAAPPIRQAPPPPFRGIIPFDYASRGLFFGREAEVEAMLAKILLNRLEIGRASC